MELIKFADFAKNIQDGCENALKENGILYLTTRNQVRIVATDPTTICVTRCSPMKSGVEKGTPEQLYSSKQSVRFFQWCKTNNLEYGILSDKYGLFMFDERREAYDLHPSELTDEGLRRLGLKIRFTMAKRERRVLLFYNPSPVMATPYFKMLLFSGLDTYYTSKLFAIGQKGFLP